VSYETFERSSVRIEELALTVAPTGRIFLNAASGRALEGAGVKAVTILWDKENCKIALKAAPKNDKNAYSIAHYGGSRSSVVTAKAFLRHVGWFSDRRQTVSAKWDAHHKMLEAELPPRFVKLRGEKHAGPGLIPSAPDPFGGNDNNRRVAERMAKDRSIIANKNLAKLSGEGTD
jgi:hypothetical protein